MISEEGLTYPRKPRLSFYLIRRPEEKRYTLVPFILPRTSRTPAS